MTLSLLLRIGFTLPMDLIGVSGVLTNGRDGLLRIGFQLELVLGNGTKVRPSLF